MGSNATVAPADAASMCWEERASASRLLYVHALAAHVMPALHSWAVLSVPAARVLASQRDTWVPCGISSNAVLLPQSICRKSTVSKMAQLERAGRGSQTSKTVDLTPTPRQPSKKTAVNLIGTSRSMTNLLVRTATPATHLSSSSSRIRCLYPPTSSCEAKDCRRSRVASKPKGRILNTFHAP